jgi:hypothetical protein
MMVSLFITKQGEKMFGKFKQALGIGTVKVELSAPQGIAKDETKIEGIVRITAQSDQTILRIHVRLWETEREGDGDTDSFKLGETTLTDGFDMTAGEVKDVPFTLYFKRRFEMEHMEGFLGQLGKLTEAMNNERSSYRLSAVVDVKGAIQDPSAHQRVIFER